MASNYPASIQTFSDPIATDTLSGHAALHTLVNDTLEAVQNKVGVVNDSDTASHDYRIRQLEADITPIGSVTMFIGSVMPSANWKLCNGAAISRTTYATLFGLVGTSYGVGNGSTTFNLPDFRNRVPVGAGSSYSLGQAIGALTDSITLSSANLPKHTHGLNDHKHSVDPPSTSVSITDNGHYHPEQGRVEGEVYANHYLQRQGGSGTNWDFYSGATVKIDSIQYPRTASATTGISASVNIAAFDSGVPKINTSTTDGGFANSAFSVDIVQPSLGINFIIKVS